MLETWLPVVGHETEYEVSNLGRVRSLTRTLRITHPSGTEYSTVRKGRILSPGRTRSGHVSVAIGRSNSRLVHHLVLEAFIGERPHGLECLHKNGVPSDNTVDNLEWGTRSKNIQDKKWQGRPTKLTIENIKRIKHKLRNGERGVDIAQQYGIHQSTVSGIKHNRFHTDVQ